MGSRSEKTIRSCWFSQCCVSGLISKSGITNGNVELWPKQYKPLPTPQADRATGKFRKNLLYLSIITAVNLIAVVFNVGLLFAAAR